MRTRSPRRWLRALTMACGCSSRVRVSIAWNAWSRRSAPPRRARARSRRHAVLADPTFEPGEIRLSRLLLPHFARDSGDGLGARHLAARGPQHDRAFVALSDPTGGA